MEATPSQAFADFVTRHEPGIRRALCAAHGGEVGREATADALAYGWQHWDRIAAMENPAGYLFRVGQTSAKRSHRGRRWLATPASDREDRDVEPGLAAALERLSEQQRVVVALVHGFEWSLSEVAVLLGVSKATVQTHEKRAMDSLRRALKVTP